jgi:hypothetical protein
MADLKRTLLDLFRFSDGLLRPDATIMGDISKKQHELRAWKEDIVFQGLNTMKEFLQELANKNRTDLVDSADEMHWVFNKGPQSQPQKRNLNFPTAWELARHLSNWIIVFIPPVRVLDLRGDMKLVSCLESTDRYISTLATIMLGNEEFNYLGSIEKFRECFLSRNSPQTPALARFAKQIEVQV